MSANIDPQILRDLAEVLIREFPGEEIPEMKLAVNGATGRVDVEVLVAVDDEGSLPDFKTYRVEI